MVLYNNLKDYQRSVKAALLLEMLNKTIRIHRHAYDKMWLTTTLHPQTEGI